MNKIGFFIFKSKFPQENFHHEGLPIALYLWNKLDRRSNEVLYIQGVFDFYDDLRLLCRVTKGTNPITSFVAMDTLYIDLICYGETRNNEFSLMVTPKSKWFKSNKSIKNLTEKIKEILNSDERFFDIRWEEVNKTSI